MTSAACLRPTTERLNPGIEDLSEPIGPLEPEDVPQRLILASRPEGIAVGPWTGVVKRTRAASHERAQMF